MITEYTIKRKSMKEEFNCPECKSGKLQFLGVMDLFRYKCRNEECGNCFM